MTRSGYKRLTPNERPDAVTWWFYRDFEDGFCYARGGRTDKVRHARKHIREQHDIAIAEHRAFLNRPTLVLKGEEMEPVNYGYGL